MSKSTETGVPIPLPHVPRIPATPGLELAEPRLKTTTEGNAVGNAVIQDQAQGAGTGAYKGFVAGVFSGVTKLTVGHPFDTLKVRLQTAPASQFSGPLDCLRKTVHKEGFRGLYKGATPPLVGWMFMDSIMLGSMTNYRTLLRRYYYEPVHSLPSSSPLPHIGNAIAGIGGGWTVSFIATPVEHIKARLQVQYHDARSKHQNTITPAGGGGGGGGIYYPGPISAIKSIGTNHGIRGLYHGLLSTILFRSHFAVMWFSISHISALLKTHTNLSEPAINFWAGGLGAQCYWLTSYPFDVVKQRIMTDQIRSGAVSREEISRKGLWERIWTGKEGYAGGEKYGKSWIRAARGVVEEGGAGWKGFWRGFTPCFLRAFPANACALMAFEGVMRWLP